MSVSPEPLLDAILADPTDLEVRSVFSDFLSEKGDPAGEYLRLEIELSKLKPNSRKAKTKRAELIKAKEAVDVKWLRRFQQPDLLLANPTRFSAIWLTSGFCDQVEIEGTYGRLQYSQIANIQNEGFDASYAWLTETPNEPRPDNAADHRAEMLRKITADAKKKKIAVPLDFYHFFHNEPNTSKIASTTGCFFELEPGFVRAPGKEGWLLRFLSDSQWCCHWYLYLDDFGGSSILWSYDYFGHDEDDLEEHDEYGVHIHYCAPDFETFVHRYWLEDRIWHHNYWYRGADWKKGKLTKEQKDYLSHYKTSQVCELEWG